MDDLKKEQYEETGIRFKCFYVITSKPEEFIEELDKLCDRYCQEEDVFYNFEFE
jgi:hypothetical protein